MARIRAGSVMAEARGTRYSEDMRIRSRRAALLVSFVLANTACSSSDDAGAGAGGAGNSGGNGASGGAAGSGNAAGAGGHAGAAGNAGFAGFGGGGAGSPGSGGTAGSGGGGGGGTGGWAGGTTGKVLVDDPTAARTWPAAHTLPDSSFDFPLTVKIGLDATWTGATASQNGNAVAVKIVQHSGKPLPSSPPSQTGDR